MNNLIFIGGIHGVGKGTICDKICEQTNFVHITASEILRWDEISKPQNKKVENIQNTQERLIAGLDEALKKNKNYLLDGHFCLFNSEGEVEKVPMETFEKIAPELIAIVTDKIDVVKERLEKRDNKTYNFDILKSMQIAEMEHARQISLELKVPFIEIKNGDYRELINLISNLK
ncbi:ATP-binding protein [Leeuwenhoekiella marinoflava]|uniref:Adenylate kinase n=2 Tax=Leeuwenhoekiella marinoflava TaxID=988 RepID=A0A4Q0PEZ1_9FLAO|nr:ATP-binding protein [Leeuwenhoekiella marinoflava]RXG25445.1 adenylate kinase [Leeuwenhoekiella marinoflava]SHF86843.1 adenylate kinase [Leeuwenhoekiella marinoflava DSM 3653]